jgi:hypothetical protein
LLAAQSRACGLHSCNDVGPGPRRRARLGREGLFGLATPVHGDGRRAGYVVVVGRPPVFAMTDPSATAVTHRFGS